MEEASAYIARNWSSTVRYATEDQGTLIGLPRPFSTPSTSGVFQELYYWDTYFINVGLLASGQTKQAENNIENMFYLIDRFGWMPNGNQTFYLCRSQPPSLSQMVRELFAHTQDQAWLRAGAYPALQQEYWFWHTHRTLDNGLSRYGGEDPDDTTLRELGRSLCKRFGLASPESPERLYPYGRAMLALAESGWDCTSRFGTEAQLYAPVDLNALLYRMERNMEWFAGVLGLMRNAASGAAGRNSAKRGWTSCSGSRSAAAIATIVFPTVTVRSCSLLPLFTRSLPECAVRNGPRKSYPCFPCWKCHMESPAVKKQAGFSACNGTIRMAGPAYSISSLWLCAGMGTNGMRRGSRKNTSRSLTAFSKGAVSSGRSMTCAPAIFRCPRNTRPRQ